jgi:hypothetical protein
MELPETALHYHLPKAGRGPRALIARHIGDVDNLLALENSTQWGIVTVRLDRMTPPDPIAELGLPVHGPEMEALTVPGSQNTKGRLA